MRILVFQHVSIEHPGHFRDLWRDAGHEWMTVELDAGDMIPALDPFGLLVVMGGPMDVWEEDRHPWLGPEKAAIRRWVRELRRPFLGICLGHQLLADALGGTVRPMTGPEVGLSSVALTAEGRLDPLLSSLAPRFRALHWHGAEVASLPEGAVALAETPACAIQAMRWREHAYGVQCHIEITAETVEDWVAIPEYRASLEINLGADGAPRLAEMVKAEVNGLNAAAKKINDAMMALATTGAPT